MCREGDLGCREGVGPAASFGRESEVFGRYLPAVAIIPDGSLRILSFQYNCTIKYNNLDPISYFWEAIVRSSREGAGKRNGGTETS